jgi:hypothetical protein
MGFMSRSVFVVLVAVFAMSVAGVASASAAECPGTVEGGGIALCSEGHEQRGSFAFSGEQRSGSLQKIFEPSNSVPVEIGCSSRTKLSKGTLVASSGGKLEISGLHLEYGQCGLISADKTTCELTKSTILVDGGEGTGTGPGLSASFASTAEVTLLGGGTLHNWTVIKLRSVEGKTCASSWEAKARGSVKCTLPESTIEAVTHILTCENTKVDGQLFNGVNSEPLGYYLTAEVKLASGKKWSLQKV